MKFDRLNIKFEIPDEWLAEGELQQWLREPRGAGAYRAMPPPYPVDLLDGWVPQDAAILVPLAAIKPVDRTLPNGTPFDKDRLLRILGGFKCNQLLPPVHTREAPSGQYRFTLYNGLHRFLASVASGFTHIPVVVSPRDEE